MQVIALTIKKKKKRTLKKLNICTIFLKSKYTHTRVFVDNNSSILVNSDGIKNRVYFYFILYIVIASLEWQVCVYVYMRIEGMKVRVYLAVYFFKSELMHTTVSLVFMNN